MSTRSPQPLRAPKSARPTGYPRWAERRDSKESSSPFHEGACSTPRSLSRALLADCKR